MFSHRLLPAVETCVVLLLLLAGSARPAPPEDFPRFQVPGQEPAMATLRELFWLHYPAAGPKSTLWDEWLPDASLWPAVATGKQGDTLRAAWASALSGRILDPEGYVASHQHASIAHQLGWPFPFWNQGQHGFGWHFSFKDTVGPVWRPAELSRLEGWALAGARDGGTNDEGWRIEVTNRAAVVTAPPWRFQTFEAPFLQLRWRAAGLGAAQPFIEWTTPARTNFTAARRMYFDPVTDDRISYTMIPMYRHAQWTGEVAQLRIGLGNPEPGHMTLQAFFSQYDTRHNINCQNFVRGGAKYFWWTRDLGFLRANINRLRTALRYVMTEHQALERKVVYTGWVGHDGRSGLGRDANGARVIHAGRGIGNNYWDLLPFGGLDAYATIQYYDAVRVMAALEREIQQHPEWQIPGGVLSFDPAMLERHAEEVKTEGNRRFWNRETQRFNACEDVDGQAYDYGLTFLNLEAVYYDFATPKHARAILSWINGDRVVAGDTSQGRDIYHWRFGPRATTRRNVDWYVWAWNTPENIPWGGQVQDGGAVLGFSFHDLMARLKVLGPDNAWQRLREVIAWFDEVQAAGGYRKYYQEPREGSLQGGGTAGGLGLDQEFFESALVPQIMLKGFLGFAPHADGFQLNPRLPRDWPELTVDRIQFQGRVWRIRATPEAIEIHKQGPGTEPLFLRLPGDGWQAALLRADGSVIRRIRLRARESDGAFALPWEGAAAARLTKAADRPLKSAAEREAFFRAQPSRPGEFRAAWIHSAYGIPGWGWEPTLATLHTNGFNAIFANLAWAGVAHYPSRILPVSPRVAEQGDQVAACLAACRQQGLELHVWKVNHNLLHAPPEFLAQLRAAGRTQKDVHGGEVDWLCPSHPDNFALERDSMLELARAYDVDGLHFDYIRYPNGHACYCDGCRQRFERDRGIRLARWPEDARTGPHAAAFGDWRREQITRLVRAVSQEAHRIKPAIKVSAAVFGNWKSARQVVGQDALAWVDAGYLDFVCPMNYEPEDLEFAELLRQQVEAVNHRIPCYAGIGAHTLSGPEQLVRQIQLARELGAEGFVLFSLTEKLAVRFLPPLRLGVTAAPPRSRSGAS
ncbi:MAG TPA: family 10 glycosylhydrolase [Verrucomicrobiota bacterium]|nr:family 10 glycosylhydrolase [Verrucomicrobiota bacterium]HPO42790.1 family 10 glycosylhydrolase [Verrucomicrobiota bacterium]